MDDLLREFLTETGEYLDIVDVELVRFEQDPNDATILRNIFRLVHTIKGTCGFLGLPRLEALAHAAESLMGRFRDGLPVTTGAVTLILATLDRIKVILGELERIAAEPAGSDGDLIGELDDMAAGRAAPAIRWPNAEAPRPAAQAGGTATIAAAPRAVATADRDAPADGGEAAMARIQTIRVNVDTLEQLMTMVSELVLTRNQLLEIARRNDNPAYRAPLQRLSHVTAELQERVMKTRMQPIGVAWQKLPRLVRDLSGELGKTIDVVIRGAETELDRQVLDLIKDPLTHLVRNAADHGIESAPERRAAGKPERGAIRLDACHEGGAITIEIADDGRGLDIPAIRRKALERGLASAAEIERMSDAQAARFIFQPGFSTAHDVTAVSGRGVGMDVVKSNIELIGGTVEIRSEQGRGATFTIKIPLTLAIIAALIVCAQGQRFAVPQAAVLELVRVQPGSAHAIERIDGAPLLRLRDQLLPILRLARLLNLAEADSERSDEGFVLVSQVGRQRFGILVDGVFDAEEIVVKPMASTLRHISLFSGNTILGDGAVVLIIDPSGIARTFGAETAQERFGSEHPAKVEAPGADETVPLLVFRGGNGLKAVPLSLVARLERIDATTIEWLGGRPLVQYRGRLMPLVPADPDIAIRREGRQALVVVADGERAMGLAVDEIVDIVDDRLDIEPAAGRPDLVGSALIRGRATEIVDIAHYLPLAHADWTRPGAARRAAPARHVLLVDGSAFFRELLTPVLKAAGFRVAAARGADDALSMLAGGARPDVVVVDLGRHGTAGLRLVEALRAEPGGTNLPVIALVCGVGPDTIAPGRNLGIAAFVTKFDRSGLLAALASTEPALCDAA